MKSKLFFIFTILALCVITIIPRMYKITAPIADWHSWRQVDTVSVSRYLLEDNFDLLHPRYLDISKVQTGYTNLKGYRFVEFPIFNALNALGYVAYPAISIDIWARIISIMAACLGSISLFLIGRKVSGYLVGLYSAVFYSIMPFNVYFTRVALPDPLAIAFMCFSIYLFLEYIDTDKKKWLFSSSVFFSLALLTKPYVIFYSVVIFYFAIKKWGIKGIFTNIPLLIALDIALIPTLLWRAWMQQPELLVGIPHFSWAFNGDAIRFRPSFWFWIFGERIGKLILGYWGLVLVGLGLVLSRKKEILYTMSFAAFLYVSIVATANVRHDYYQTLIIPPIALSMGMGVYYSYSVRYVNKLAVLIVQVFSILLMVLLSFYHVREFYKINDTIMLEAAKRTEEVTEKDSLVIAPYNGSTVFLYHTGRAGWPVVTHSIDELIEWGADYYVSTSLHDSDTKNFKERFVTVEETNKYIIIDLKNEKK